MNCIMCEEPISHARLRAVPNAVLCVPCKESSGDEPRLKRLDQYYDGELLAETTFRSSDIGSQYVQSSIDSLMMFEGVTKAKYRQAEE